MSIFFLGNDMSAKTVKENASQTVSTRQWCCVSCINGIGDCLLWANPAVNHVPVGIYSTAKQ